MAKLVLSRCGTVYDSVLFEDIIKAASMPYIKYDRCVQGVRFSSTDSFPSKVIHCFDGLQIGLTRTTANKWPYFARHYRPTSRRIHNLYVYSGIFNKEHFMKTVFVTQRPMVLMTRTCFTSVHIEDQIKKTTELCTSHATPEIKLYLITPNTKLWHSPGEKSPFVDPFWAFYWPGGQALSRYILDNPSVVLDKRILDVGSGCGATAIACQLAGARVVTANDIDTVAASAIRLNARANGTDLNIETADLIGQSGLAYDVIIIGDMFYDPDFAKTLVRWIKVLKGERKTVLIGDPGRAGFTSIPSSLNLQEVFKTRLSETTARENNGLVETSVWRC